MNTKFLRLKTAMRAVVLMLMLVVIGITRGVAERVTPEVARNVAMTFFNNNGVKSSTVTDISKAAGFSNLYIFNADNGFVILSADDQFEPILGYSLTGCFVAENMPENLQWWLNGYNDDIQYVVDNNIKAASNVTQIWNDLKYGKSDAGKSDIVVDELLKTRWHQVFPYNKQCPNNCATGCVATAMAQIMKKWNYPIQGIGYHEYEWNNTMLSANFGATTYDWSNMDNVYNSSGNGIVHDDAVATLMFHCGVSVKTNYGISYSSATMYDAAVAMKRNFGYSNDANYKKSFDVSYDTWIAMMKADLNNGWPLLYGGDKVGGGGHCFVCDGYDSDDKFHFNFGWENTGANGYFLISEITYNQTQDAVFKIHPESVSVCDAPTNLSAEVFSNNVHLTWTAAEGVESYRIYRDDVMLQSAVTGTSYTDSGLEFGNHIYYMRSNCADESTSTASNTVQVEIEPSCSAPTNLSAAVNSNTVTLTWTAAEGVESYRIYCDGMMLESAITGTSYTYNVFILGDYAYYLKSNCYDESTSAASNTVQVEIESSCSAPTNLSASVYNNDVTLTWTAAEGVESYRIYRDDVMIESAVTGTNYADIDLELGDYIYYLRSNCSDESTSAASNTVQVEIESSCSAPTNLSASVYNNNVTLTWNAAEGVESYRIYRDDVMIESAVTGTNYADIDLELGDYIYYLRSNCSDESTSAASNTVIAEVYFPGNDTATIGDLRYSLNTQKHVAQVIWPESGYYSGNLTIPALITYNNVIYTVISIGSLAFEYCSGLTSLTIPNSVTTIGYGAFKNCLNLTTVVFGDQVQTIPDYAFFGCSGLTSLTIPNSVTTIGSSAFYGCSGLTSLTLGNSVTTIGYRAFDSCTGLTSLTIPNSVTTIGNCAFIGCSGLTSLTIPNSVTTIGYDAFGDCSGLTHVYWNAINVTDYPNYSSDIAFYGCSNLTTVVFGDQVQTIPDYAFYGCSGLTSLTVPNSVTTIGDCAFEDCSGLTSLTLPNSVTTIGYDAFGDCSGLTHVYWNAINVTDYPNYSSDNAFYGCSNLTTVVFGDQVQTIPSNAFRNCSGLTSLTIPNSVTTIGNNAFEDCSGLTSLTIPNSVTTIGNNAFEDCSGLTSLTVPNSVTAIGSSAFRNCSGLTHVYWNAINVTSYPNSNYFNAFNGCSNLTTVVFGDQVQTIPDYAFVDCSGLTSLTLPNSVTTIGDCAFEDCSGLTSLTLPNSVTTIGDCAFEDCSGLASLTIGNSVTTIGNGVFSGCSGLTGSLIIPNSVTTIGDYAFEDCSGLASLTIGNSVTTIGNYAFLRCSGFTGSLTIPNSVTTIGNYAFSRCSGFTGSLIIPNSVTTIGNYAFAGCSFNGLNINITEIATGLWRGAAFTGPLIIGNSVTAIGEDAFSGCSGFTGSLTIPNSVTTIGNCAFEDCSGLASLTIGNSVTTIGNYAFSRCSGLASLTIGNSVTTIGNGVFSGCSGLTGSLIIPNSVTTIGWNAFSGCSGLTSLTIPNSVITIGDGAFYGCSGLNAVYYQGDLKQWCDISFSYESNPLEYAHKLYINNELVTDLVIPESVGEIKSYTFAGCSSLTSLTLGNSVTTIGWNAFSGCSGLTSLTIPNSVTTIGDYAFEDCSGLASLTIGNSVTTIGNCVFSGCSGLTSLTIPNSVTTIGSYAFSGCSGLTSLTIPNSVTSIEYRAFENCSGLSSIKLPNSVTTIGSSILDGCNNLTYIEIECMTPPTVYQYTFYGVDKYVSVKVPCGTQDEYKFAQYWSEFENIHETEYGLIVTRNDEYGGEVSILDMADCEDNHCAILAEPSVGYTFNGWYVDDEFVAGSALCDFSLTEDVAFEARFTRNENHHIANGTSNTWSNPNTWDTGEVPTETSTVAVYKNIVVDVDANVSAIGVYRDNTITITPDVVLAVEDELVSDNASSIIIEDGGQIIHSNEDVMATVEKTIEPFTSDEDGWNLISLPLIDNGTVASVTNMLSNEYDLFAYDEPSYTWINQKEENNNFAELEAGMGYLYANIGKEVHIPIGAKIGNGTSRTDCSPYNTNWKYSIAENLYLVSELEAAGISTSELGALCWYATNENGYQQSNITIWMANVSDTELTETSHNVSEMTLVYTGDMTPVIGWNEFVFNENNFTWDGTSNILVCVQRNNGVYNSTIYWQAHDPGFPALSYKYTDNSAYDMTTETYSMTVSDYSRPNTIFQTVEQVGEFENYEPITMSFAGEIENGTAEITVPLSYTGGNTLSGFNLVGNPFVHNVTSYEGNNVADGCYRINDAKTNLIVNNISNENPLKVGEGFFVKATGDNASITFNSQTRKSPDERGFVQLELIENDKIIDRLIVKKDGVPLKKMSLRGNHTELFARYDSERVSIVPIQGPAQPVCFKAVRMGSYTITVDIENLDIDYLHLIDNFTGKDIDLLIEPQYTFVGASDDNESRFRLVFDKSANVNNSEIFAYQNGNEIIVSGNGTLQIFDVMGRMVATQPINGVETMYTSSLQTGVYIFRLLGESPRTQKIVVR